jgi:hypothetical protein
MVRRSTPGKLNLLDNSLPTRVEAALAVMQMGVTDYATIAFTVGLPQADVIEIDHADDHRIRHLAVRGLDPEKRFHLVHPIRCPKCRNRITVVPCLTCRGI